MKTLPGIQIILFFLLSQTYPGQSQQLFHDTYDVANFTERPQAITSLSNDDLVMIGESSKSAFGFDSYNFLHRTDANGNTLIHRYYQEVSAKCIHFEDIVAGDYGYITVGRTMNPTGTVQQITKLHADGTVHWANKITHQPWQGEVHDPDLNGWNDIHQVNEETFVLGGFVSFKKDNQRKYYAQFAMMDLSGQILQNNLVDLTPYNGLLPNDFAPVIVKIVQVGNSFIATGIVYENHVARMIILKLNYNLQVQWFQLVSYTHGSVIPTGMVTANQQEFIIVGKGYTVFTLRMNIYGQIINQFNYKWPNALGQPQDVHIDSSGDVYVTGSCFIDKFPGEGDVEVFLLKTDPWGFVNSLRHFGKNGIYEYTKGSVKLNNGLFAIHAEMGGQAQQHLLSVSASAPYPCGDQSVQVEQVTEEYIFFDFSVDQRESEIEIHEMEINSDVVEIQRETCGHTNPEEMKLPNSLNLPPSQNQNIEFAIYPNPTPGVIDISWKNSENFVVDRIEVYEITGKKVISEKVRQYQFKTILPNSGIYIVALKDRVGQTIQREKVIRY